MNYALDYKGHKLILPEAEVPQGRTATAPRGTALKTVSESRRVGIPDSGLRFGEHLSDNSYSVQNCPIYGPDQVTGLITRFPTISITS